MKKKHEFGLHPTLENVVHLCDGSIDHRLHIFKSPLKNRWMLVDYERNVWQYVNYCPMCGIQLPLGVKLYKLKEKLEKNKIVVG